MVEDQLPLYTSSVWLVNVGSGGFRPMGNHLAGKREVLGTWKERIDPVPRIYDTGADDVCQKFPWVRVTRGRLYALETEGRAWACTNRRGWPGVGMPDACLPRPARTRMRSRLVYRACLFEMRNYRIVGEI